MVIDDGLVIELGRADTQAFMGIGRGDEVTVILQESLNARVILGGGLAERGLLWPVIDAG